GPAAVQLDLEQLAQQARPAGPGPPAQKLLDVRAAAGPPLRLEAVAEIVDLRLQAERRGLFAGWVRLAHGRLRVLAWVGTPHPPAEPLPPPRRRGAPRGGGCASACAPPWPPTSPGAGPAPRWCTPPAWPAPPPAARRGPGCPAGGGTARPP